MPRRLHLADAIPKKTAQAVYAGLSTKALGSHWALELARLCLDMKTGQLQRFPESGGALEQSSLLIESMRTAWTVWYILNGQAQGRSPTSEEQEFLTWVLDD